MSNITKTVDVPATGPIVIRVINTKTGKSDVLHLDISEQGSSYHVLLSKFEDGRMKGRVSMRELIDAIGDFAAEG